jgi:hypothetical protein
MMDDPNKAAVADILDTHTPEIQSLVHALREVIRAAAPELTEEVKPGWGNLVYKLNGVVCAISPYSNHVNVNFYKGTSLSDPAGVLDGTGRELRHVKYRTESDIQSGVLSQLVHQAVQLDEHAR